MIMTVDPGQQLTMPLLNVPAVFLVIEGSGDPIESGYAPPIILRPGRAYFMPSGADPLTFTVGAAQKGPLKVHTVHTLRHEKHRFFVCLNSECACLCIDGDLVLSSLTRLPLLSSF